MRTTFLAAAIGGLLMGFGVYSQPTQRAETTPLTIINPPELYDPTPNGYSHAIVVEKLSRVAFISGQGGERADGYLPSQFDQQVRQAYRNLSMALRGIGAQPRQVVKLTTYVVDHDSSKLAVLTEVLKDTFGEALPAQTLVPVSRLALDGMQFEVDAVVALDP